MSRSASAAPRSPATVEKRTKSSVFGGIGHQIALNSRNPSPERRQRDNRRQLSPCLPASLAACGSFIGVLDKNLPALFAPGFDFQRQIIFRRASEEPGLRPHQVVLHRRPPWLVVCPEAATPGGAGLKETLRSWRQAEQAIQPKKKSLELYALRIAPWFTWSFSGSSGIATYRCSNSRQAGLLTHGSSYSPSLPVTPEA